MRPNNNFKKRFACILNFALVSVLVWSYQPNGYNLTSVLVLINSLGHTFISVLNINQFAWPQLDISSWSYQSTWPQTDISPSHLKCQAMLLILLCLAAPFLTAQDCFFNIIKYYVHKNICTYVHYKQEF